MGWVRQRWWAEEEREEPRWDVVVLNVTMPAQTVPWIVILCVGGVAIEDFETLKITVMVLFIKAWVNSERGL